jgi:hypothetical protein
MIRTETQAVNNPSPDATASAIEEVLKQGP